MRSNTCLKCNSSMTEGFVVDHGYGSNTVSNWVEGAPIKSFWTGVKLGGKRHIPVQTWRCGRCGYLESYARG